MGFACISVPIRNKQIQMYANTQTLDLIAFVSWLSFVLLLYTFWQISSQNYCGITDSVYSVTLLTELFVSIRSSNTQKQRWRLYCTETAGFQPSFPPLPRLFSSSLYLGWILFFLIPFLKKSKYKQLKEDSFPDLQFLLFSKSSLRCTPTRKNASTSKLHPLHLQNCTFTALTWGRILHDVLSSSMGVQCVARSGL